MTAFVQDPIATHSGQFPLGRPDGVPVSVEVPSARGLRPWGLLRLEDGVPERLVDVSGWVYDPFRQVMVDREGVPVVVGPPTAKSISNNDGDEGPNEDWQHDFCPDEPFEV